MDQQAKKPPDAAILARNGKLFQLCGLVEVFFGILTFFLGPLKAPDLGTYWWYASGFLVAIGLGLIVYGRILVARARPPDQTVMR